MESEDQVSAVEKSFSENEGIELQIRISSAPLPSEQHDPGSVTENLEEIKHASDEDSCMPKKDKDKDISSTESSNDIAELKSEAARDESENVSVEKEESLCLLTESSNISANKEESDTLPVEVGDISSEKDLSQVKSTEPLSSVEQFETTSNESKISTSPFDDKDLNCTNRLASSDNLTQQSSDSANMLKYTGKASQTFNEGTESKLFCRSIQNQNEEPNSLSNVSSNTPSKDRVLQVKSLLSLCMEEKSTECGHLREHDDSMKEKIDANSNEESISSGKLQAAGDESFATKDSTVLVGTTGVKNTSKDVTADIINTVSNENSPNTACKTATTENKGDKKIPDKLSEDTSGTVGGENVTKEHSNISDKIEMLRLKQGENVAIEQVTTAKTAVDEATSNETADVDNSETQPQPEEPEDDRERAAFFYISSCSVPGMGAEWEWPSVSSECHYQRPSRRMERRRNRAESRNCLGSQRCHYIILAVGVLGAILGCLTYHLQDYGIGPKVLRPIGASAAFLSFVVCAFSSVYLTYLSYYTHGRSSHNYQPLDASDPVASMLINTVPQAYSSDPRFYFTSSAAATAQQVYRDTQSADALDRRGYSWHQSEIKRPFNEPGPSGYDPHSKRFKMDETTSEGEVYEMQSMRKISETDQCKVRTLSQSSDSSHYTLADQVYPSNSSKEDENTENTPLLQKK